MFEVGEKVRVKQSSTSRYKGEVGVVKEVRKEDLFLWPILVQLESTCTGFSAKEIEKA